VRAVVYDTNIYISALITPGGRGEQALQLAISERVRPFSSVPILTELAGKLQGKFAWDEEQVKKTISFLAAVATVVRPELKVTACADEPDNRILECAVTAGAQVIVTGDRHLLCLGSYEDAIIVTLADFLTAEC
jgi:putative PIN family toxin of toxin-antitoxin system